MHQLSKSSLPYISGGFSSWQLPGSTVAAASAKPVPKASLQVHPAANNPFAGLQSDAEGASNYNLHTWTAPKNGDRNSLGQIYSWGSWGDDNH